MKESIEKFLESKEKDIQELAGLYPNKKSLILDYQELEEFDHKLAEKLVKEPDEVLEIFNAVLQEKPLLV